MRSYPADALCSRGQPVQAGADGGRLIGQEAGKEEWAAALLSLLAAESRETRFRNKLHRDPHPRQQASLS